MQLIGRGSLDAVDDLSFLIHEGPPTIIPGREYCSNARRMICSSGTFAADHRPPGVAEPSLAAVASGGLGLIDATSNVGDCADARIVVNTNPTTIKTRSTAAV